MEKFIMIPDVLIEQYQDVSAMAKLAYAVIRNCSVLNGKKYSGVSQAKLAQILRITRKTAAKYMQELIRADLLRAVYMDGKIAATQIVELDFRRFYALPMEILHHPNLSLKEKLLFALMLSRSELSRKNGNLLDEEEQVTFWVMQIRDIRAALHISHSTAVRMISHLVKEELIDRCVKGGRCPAVNTMKSMNAEHKPKQSFTATGLKDGDVVEASEFAVVSEEVIPFKVCRMRKNETSNKYAGCVKMKHQTVAVRSKMPPIFFKGMSKNNTLSWVKLKHQYG